MICMLIVSTAPVMAMAASSGEQARASDAQTRAIAQDLSCVVCEGQSVASSNAKLAGDMRRFIADKLRTGKSEKEIKAFLRDRYGDRVLMTPPLRPATWLLWAAPLLVLLAGGLVIGHYFRKQYGAEDT